MDARTSEQVHQLATTTFRNIEDTLPELKNLITVGKNYQKALQNASLIASQFYHLIGAIGVRLSSLPGSVRRLGQSFYQISVAHREIAPTENSWVDSLMADLLGPLEMKISKETKNYAGFHKTYKQSVSRQQQEVAKQESNLKSHRKKEKKRLSQSAIGGSQHLQAYTDSVQKLDNMRKEGLRKALLEERKLYCFTMEHFCNAFNAEAAFHAKSHEEITKRIPDLLASASDPNELPEESAVLLEDPLSPKALQSPIKPNSSATTDDYDAGNLLSADSQDDVFVFNAPQTGLVRAKDSVAVMKGKSKTASDESPSTSSTRLPSQPSKNTFTFVPQASRISTAQVATQVTKKPSCRVRGLYEYNTSTVGQLPIKVAIEKFNIQPTQNVAMKMKEPTWMNYTKIPVLWKFANCARLGDIIDAVSEPRDGWQYGENVETGKKGWFPSHYVLRVRPSRESQRQNGKQGQQQIPPPDYD